jgi:hypothetical protein
MPQRLAELIGPYEYWAHGTGALYNSGKADTAATQYIAAVAELPAGTDPTKALPLDMHVDPSSSDQATAYLPTLWQPTFQKTADFGAERIFCPLVLHVPRIAGSQDLRHLEVIASCLGHVTKLLKPRNTASVEAKLERPLDDESSASAEFGYRLNTAIP